MKKNKADTGFQRWGEERCYLHKVVRKAFPSPSSSFFSSMCSHVLLPFSFLILLSSVNSQIKNRARALLIDLPTRIALK